MEVNARSPQTLFATPILYEIPPFQRRYVWGQEQQWDPLWDDVERLAESEINNPPSEVHFMGAIVLQQKQSPTGTIQRRIVVDGQQRLITLQLLTGAIQKVLMDREHPNPAMRLADLVVNGEGHHRGEPDHVFKVLPNPA